MKRSPKPEDSTAQPKKGKVAAKEPSDEYKAFEALAKQVLSVPKAEIDRREAEYKASRRKSSD
ncbi:MAG: hypothetical protein ACYC96_01355 [Fimbriimonadaceae bacterium]